MRSLPVVEDLDVFEDLPPRTCERVSKTASRTSSFFKVVSQYQRETGRQLSRDQIRQAHDEFGRQDNPNYHDLLQILRDTFGE